MRILGIAQELADGLHPTIMVRQTTLNGCPPFVTALKTFLGVQWGQQNPHLLGLIQAFKGGILLNNVGQAVLPFTPGPVRVPCLTRRS
jgi:hypothetical protein